MTHSLANASDLKEKLKNIAEAEPASIRGFVAAELLACPDEDPARYLDYLFRYGCQNGAVSGLIWYRDTHQFFDIYYDEIEDLRQDTEEETGTPLSIQGDLKNALAWFAFEAVAYQMAMELGLDV